MTQSQELPSSLPKSGPRWMSWIVALCLVLVLAVGLMIDLNGNIAIDPSGTFPDLLEPGPLLLMVFALGAGFIVSVIHVVRFGSKRIWFAIALLFLILTVAAFLPML